MAVIVLIVGIVTFVICIWNLAQGLGNIVRHESDE